jgi:DNA-binding response OmpR family regulator
VAEAALEQRRILVVEDEYFIADDIATALRKAGACVIGPLATVAEAAALVEREPIDAALLDVNLRGETILPLADVLTARGIPFAFATGYDDEALPARFVNVPRVLKPFRADQLAEAAAMLVRGVKQPG